MHRLMDPQPQHRLRIARVVPALDFGGVETRVALQAEGHDRDSYAMHVVGFGTPGRMAVRVADADVPVHALETSPRVGRLDTTLRLARKLRHVAPDVVHASVGEGMFHGLLAARVAGVPRVILEEVGVPHRSDKARLVFGGLYRFADAIVAVSHAVRDYLISHEWAPQERTKVLYTCARPEFFEPPVPRDALTTRPFRFLTVGRLVPQKNLDLLLRAFAAMTDGRSSELWLAGDGPLRQDLAVTCQALGIVDRVRFLGFQEDVRRLLDESDAFVFPALPGEGCSNALLEALARATPTIVSSSPGNPEVAGELGDEWVISPHDVVAWTTRMQALRDMSLGERTAHGMRGREIAQRRFSPGTYLEGLDALYREVLAGPPAAPWKDRSLSRIRSGNGNARIAAQ